jgi:curved DNA-binding protein CbpA
MKYFTNIKTIEELKKAYKRLAMQHHPDKGGTTEQMQEINAEYEKMFNLIKSGQTNATEENSEDFIEVVNAIINCIGLEIEICGNWIWVSGDTYTHKETLKKNGFRWAVKKRMWYWRPAGYVKKTKKQYSMEEIRKMHGSEKIKTGFSPLLA